MKKKIFLIALALVMLLSSMVIIPTSATETPVILGASIRTEGTQGLRFVGKIKKSDHSLTLGDDANFGILLLPANKVNAGTNITVDTTGAKKVPAKIIMSEATVTSLGIAYDDAYWYFSAVVTGIPKENYGTDLIARVYIQNGASYTYSAQTTRSVIYIANAIVDAGEATTAINTVVSDYNAVGSDILVDGSNFGL